MSNPLTPVEACDLAENLVQAKYDFEMMCGPDPHPLHRIAFAAFDVAIANYKRVWGHSKECICVDCCNLRDATNGMIEALKNG